MLISLLHYLLTNKQFVLKWARFRPWCTLNIIQSHPYPDLPPLLLVTDSRVSTKDSAFFLEQWLFNWCNSHSMYHNRFKINCYGVTFFLVRAPARPRMRLPCACAGPAQLRKRLGAGNPRIAANSRPSFFTTQYQSFISCVFSTHYSLRPLWESLSKTFTNAKLTLVCSHRVVGGSHD